MSQYNHVNIPLLINNLKRVGQIAHMHDGKEFGEKGIQPVKNEFVSKKGKFAGNLMEKLYSDKIMNQLANDEQCESSSKCDLSNYHMRSNEFLKEKLKRGLPVPFVLNENEECLFLMNDGPAKNFVFSKHVKTLMGLNYFELENVKNMQSPLCLLKKGVIKKCALLATKIEGTNNYCYAGVSNDWCALNKLGDFRVMNEFNYK